MTLAFDAFLLTVLGDDVSLTAECTISSGAYGVMKGALFFNPFGIPENNFVSRGFTYGVNFGSIMTACLWNVDAYAVSLNFLTFSVFRTIVVIMASLGI